MVYIGELERANAARAQRTAIGILERMRRRYKRAHPIGWKNESVRHSLARKGVKTGRKSERPYWGFGGVRGKTKKFRTQRKRPIYGFEIPEDVVR